jgi:hypothetical protein
MADFTPHDFSIISVFLRAIKESSIVWSLIKCDFAMKNNVHFEEKSQFWRKLP